jgi:hypothetical protein
MKIINITLWRLGIVVLLFFSMGLVSAAENLDIKFVIIDREAKMNVSNVKVEILRDSKLVTTLVTDMNGYLKSSVPAGLYTLKFSVSGFKDFERTKELTTTTDFLIRLDKIQFFNTDIKPVVKDPIHEKVQITPPGIVTLIENGDNQNESDIVIRRAGKIIYLLDGISVQGNLSANEKDVEQIKILSGGIPGDYGDINSGIINITNDIPVESGDLSSILKKEDVGVSDMKINNSETASQIRFTIFPNPSTGNIDISADNGVEEIFVYDINGILYSKYNVNQSLNYHLDLSELSNGTYLIKMKSVEMTGMARMVINR